MKRLFLYDPESARREEVLANAMEHVRACGAKVTILVDEPKKSRLQEEHYHAQIGDIAAQVEWLNKRWPADVWKRLLIDAFRHDTKQDPALAPLWATWGGGGLAPALNHDGFVQLGEQSRNFGVRLASAFIDWLYAFGAEHDVRWTPRPDPLVWR